MAHSLLWIAFGVGCIGWLCAALLTRGADGERRCCAGIPTAFLVAAAVRAFLAQRLVRRLCPHCKAPYEMTAKDRRDFNIPGHIAGQAYSAVGCDRCRNTGYSGRLAIYEAALLTQAMQDLIAHGGATSKALHAQALKDGYVPIREYGLVKVMQD